MKAKNLTYLNKYKDTIMNAYHHDYAYSLPTSILQEFQRIIFEETGKPYNTNLHCSTCILKLLKKTAKLILKNDGN